MSLLETLSQSESESFAICARLRVEKDGRCVVNGFRVRHNAEIGVAAAWMAHQGKRVKRRKQTKRQPLLMP